MKHIVKNQKGQGMVEYIIIVALIAIAAIGVYSQFGKGVRSQMAGMTQELSGTSADVSDAQAAATKAKTLAETENNLSNYNQTATTGTEE
jgi:Flp pilus assembly pilin Flp